MLLKYIYIYVCFVFHDQNKILSLKRFRLYTVIPFALLLGVNLTIELNIVFILEVCFQVEI